MTGWHFLQIPGPTNVPARVLRALAQPVIDHRSPAFAELALEVLGGLREVVRTGGRIALYPSSGTGAWEAALVNTLSPGDAVLVCENGHFAQLWGNLAEKLGLTAIRLEGDWRLAPDPAAVETRLAEDEGHAIRAVLLVHNETSTGVTSRVPEIRAALDRQGHPALLLVDTISSLASIDYRHDEWGVDVTIGCSQKGLMLPPGLGFNAVGENALAAEAAAATPRGYWDWGPVLAANETGFFPYTPPTSLLYGLREALAMVREEGLEHVFARHARHGGAARAAVDAWGLELFAREPADRSDSLTAVLLPDGCDADAVRRHAYDTLDLSLGTGLGRLAGQVFRIGHLGDLNDLMLLGTLGGVELALEAAGVPFDKGAGMTAALRALAGAGP
jgi:alanine-glyoxylate transaminase / serine-glyoxylate transaminase / serine-pyruvate transaminase